MMAVHTPIRDAKRLVRRKKKDEARAILIRALRANQDDAEAWYFLAYLVEDQTEATHCLKQVLRIDPRHRRARTKLRRLNRQQQSDRPRSRVRPAYVVVGLGIIVAIALMTGALSPPTASIIPPPESQVADDTGGPTASPPGSNLAPITVPTKPPPPIAVVAVPPATPGYLPITEPEQVEVPTEPVPDQVVIQFTEETTEEEQAAYIESIGGTISETIDGINTVVVTVPEDVAGQPLPESPAVAKSEPDYYVSAFGYSPPNDPRFAEQWALPAIGAPDAWAELPADAPIYTVAVIDSGVCANHPDLAGRIGAGWDFLEEDNAPQDEFGHGCAVAGIIAANINDGIGIAGVAPNTRIMPLRVLNASGVGTYSDVAAAIVYATENGAEIINLSLGGSYPSSVLKNAVNYADLRGVTIVAAAGNTGTEDVMYPAAYEPVIAVGSVDPGLHPSAFSNYGADIDLWAPGRDILTTKSGGGYGLGSGTSFAAPHVAGAAVLEMALGGTLKPDGDVVSVVGMLVAEWPTPSPTPTEVPLLEETPTPESPSFGSTNYSVLSDGQFVYGPNIGEFSIIDFIRVSAPHLLKYAEDLYGRSEYYSINPKVYLTLVEISTGLVSNQEAQSDDLENPLGFKESGFLTQLDRLSVVLVSSYYLHLNEFSPLPVDERVLPGFALPDDTYFGVPPATNAGTYAVIAALAQLRDADGMAITLDNSNEQSFYQTYLTLFPDDDPLNKANHIYIPGEPAAQAAPPDLLQLPYRRGESWKFNGVHDAAGANYGDPGTDMSSIDFSPGWPSWGADTSNMWVVAGAAGTATKISDCNFKITHSDGWETVYYHLENIQVSGGSIQQNELIGVLADTLAEATCNGGWSTGPHVHFTLKRNGAWVALNGTALSGWYVHSGRYNYDSDQNYMWLERDGAKKYVGYWLLNDAGSSPTCYSLYVEKQGNGRAYSVPSTSSCGFLSFPAGTSVTLHAEPDPGWSFSHWINASGGAVTSYTVNSNATVTAVFTQDQPSTGNWKADYYDTTDRWWDTNNSGNFKCSENITGPSLDKNYGTSAPCGMDGDTWVGDYSATINFSSGNYVFWLEHDDAAKLWLNGGNIQDRGGSGSGWVCPARYLSGNQQLRVLLREDYGDAKIKLTWTTNTSVCNTNVPPDEPTNLQASNNRQTGITLTWSDVSNETGYKIYEWEGEDGFVYLASVGANVTSYTDNRIPCGSDEYYEVSAFNDYGESDHAGWVHGFTLACATPPSPPTNVAASDGTYTDRVRVTWSSSSGATSYRVYRATSSGGTKTYLGSTSSTSFDDYLAAGDIVYYYWVKACNSNGCSDYSSYNTGWRPDTTPPDGGITSPSHLSATNDTTLNIIANASDNGSGVNRVEFYVWHCYDSCDWRLLGTDYSAPYSQIWDWSTLPDMHVWLTIHIYDNAGNVNMDPGGYVEVDLDRAEPSVSITEPSENDYLTTDQIPIQTTVSDSLSGVCCLQFFVWYTDQVGGAGALSAPDPPPPSLPQAPEEVRASEVTSQAYEWHVIGWDTNGSDGWSFAWDASGVPDQGDVAFFVYAYDKAGNYQGVGVWSTVLDRTRPTSFVWTLPATSGPSFSVSWFGTDATSGIASYDVQYQDNGGAWTNWQTGITTTSASFTGVVDHTYGFRVRARDNAGNLEVWPAVPDTETTIVAPPDNDDFSSPRLISIMPYSDTLNVAGAMSAPDDPPFTDCGIAPGYATVWYRYTPSQISLIRVDTNGSNYDTVLGVWTLETDSLHLVGCNDDTSFSLQSEVTVPVVGGKTYYIEVAEFGGYLSGQDANASGIKSSGNDVGAQEANTLQLHIESIACYALETDINPADGGVVSTTPANCGVGSHYGSDTVVQLTATANVGFTFSAWSGDASGSANPTSVTMDTDRIVTANFTPVCYTVTTSADPPEGGSVGLTPAPNCSGGRYTYGTKVTLTANANTGYSFAGWSGGAGGTSNPTTVTLYGDKNITANFDLLCYTLTIDVRSEDGGSVSPSLAPNCNGGTQYTHGTVVSLLATANEGYTFSAWGGGVSGKDNPIDVLMDGVKNVIAVFILAPIEDFMHIGDVEINISDTQPVEVEVQVKSYLPDSCTHFDRVEQSRSGNDIDLQIFTTRPADVACAQKTRPFSKVIPLEGDFPPGDYVVTINDKPYPFAVP